MIKATYERAPMTQTQTQVVPRVGTQKITTKGFVDRERTLDNLLPINFGFRYDPKRTIIYKDETPTAEFYYDESGNPNTYALGRILTGSVVPGTSGENWNGRQTYGGSVQVVNTKGQNAYPWNVRTLGSSKDNKTNWYHTFAHKKGGKLIPRK